MPGTYRSAALDFDALRRELDLVEPTSSVAVAVLDLDGFGHYNQTNGDDGGDTLLARCETALAQGLPDGALVGHVRGDEFAIVAPDSSPETLLIALDGTRQAIADTEAVTLSAGIAGRPQHGTSGDELLSAADTALVRSKRDGGNRISMAVTERMVLKTSYYTPAALHRLAKLANRTGRPEASLLREALDDLLAKHRD
jgi:diguanylate cyclase